MKIFKLILILSIVLGLITCSNSKNLQPEKSIEKPDSLPVLEINTEFRGNWDINGKMLDFSLYENGFVEYEILDTNKRISGEISKTDDIKIKKHTQISEDEVRDLLNLLTSNEFLSLENSYEPKRRCTDSYIYDMIRFQYKNKSKIININGYCENIAYTHSQGFPNFPSILSDLYKRIDKIKTLNEKKT